MKRKIPINIIIDWEDYDDVCDELVIEDVFSDFTWKYGSGYEMEDKNEKEN